MSAPAKAPAPAPQDEELSGDYRKHLGKSYLGRWDLQNADKTYRPALVTIASVHKYTPPPFLLKKQLRQAEKTGRPVKREFLIKFVGFRKGWILRKEALDSVAEALRGVLGPDRCTDLREWKGQEIVLFVDPDVMLSGKKVGGIRARAKKGSQVIAPPEDNEPDEDVQAMLAAAYGEGEGGGFGGDAEPAP